jgi:hypothetical protein
LRGWSHEQTAEEIRPRGQGAGPLSPDFRDLLSAFNAHRVEYLVVGAHALAAHGHVRATGDLDVWVRPERGNANRVIEALREFGALVQELAAPTNPGPGRRRVAGEARQAVGGAPQHFRDYEPALGRTCTRLPRIDLGCSSLALCCVSRLRLEPMNADMQSVDRKK